MTRQEFLKDFAEFLRNHQAHFVQYYDYGEDSADQVCEITTAEWNMSASEVEHGLPQDVR